MSKLGKLDEIAKNKNFDYVVKEGFTESSNKEEHVNFEEHIFNDGYNSDAGDFEDSNAEVESQDPDFLNAFANRNNAENEKKNKIESERLEKERVEREKEEAKHKKLQAEREEAERIKKELEEKTIREAEERKKREEEEARIKAEAERKAQEEEEVRIKAEAERQAKLEAEKKAQEEEEARVKAEEQLKIEEEKKAEEECLTEIEEEQNLEAKTEEQIEFDKDKAEEDFEGQQIEEVNEENHNSLENTTSTYVDNERKEINDMAKTVSEVKEGSEFTKIDKKILLRLISEAKDTVIPDDILLDKEDIQHMWDRLSNHITNLD